jgi:SAM-dependent methyltransferase
MELSYYKIYDRMDKENWWFEVRRKIIGWLIKRYLPEKIGRLSILDIGCGTGVLMTELKKFGQVTGIDLSEEALAFCRQKGIRNVKRGDVLKIPEPDKKYDLALALDVIEHVENDQQAISEIRRVLKPGGLAIIFVPAFMFLWGVTDIVSHHFRRYTKSQLVKKLLANDFKIERASYFNTFLFPPIFLVRFASRFLPSKRKDDFFTGAGLVNKILGLIFSAEAIALRLINFPFGVSIMVVAKTPEKPESDPKNNANVSHVKP